MGWANAQRLPTSKYRCYIMNFQPPVRSITSFGSIAALILWSFFPRSTLHVQNKRHSAKENTHVHVLSPRSSPLGRQAILRPLQKNHARTRNSSFFSYFFPRRPRRRGKWLPSSSPTYPTTVAAITVPLRFSFRVHDKREGPQEGA